VETTLANHPDVLVSPLVSSAFDENAYVVHWTDRKDCLVIDPGLDPSIIFEYLDRHSLVPAAILNTHGHVDHIAGNAPLKTRWPLCPIVIGAGDAAKLVDPQQNLSAVFGFALRSPPADVMLNELQVYSAAGMDLETLAIPGHSAGHVVYLWKSRKPYLAFVGDVIFAGSIGRADFPDGDFDQLTAGIRAKLFTLPDDTMLYPGHGPSTTIGRERKTNPFVGDRQ
jgi:hydroxyacylglutathione hydrolase